jgi:hypothetical protein
MFIFWKIRTITTSLKLNTNMIFSIFYLTLPMLIVTMVSGYSLGPGVCLGGLPAVRGLHIRRRRFLFSSRKVISKSYDDANVAVSIGGLAMTPGNECSLPAGIAHRISVSGQDIKGLLEQKH